MGEAVISCSHSSSRFSCNGGRASDQLDGSPTLRDQTPSQNFRTITPHAGVARRFLVYDIAPGEPPHEVDRWDLPGDMAVREFRGPGPHPLDAVDVMIAGSAGLGFVRQMATRNVRAVVSPAQAPAWPSLGLCSGR